MAKDVWDRKGKPSGADMDFLASILNGKGLNNLGSKKIVRCSEMDDTRTEYKRRFMDLLDQSGGIPFRNSLKFMAMRVM